MKPPELWCFQSSYRPVFCVTQRARTRRSESEDPGCSLCFNELVSGCYIKGTSAGHLRVHPQNYGVPVGVVLPKSCSGPWVVVVNTGFCWHSSYKPRQITGGDPIQAMRFSIVSSNSDPEFILIYKSWLFFFAFLTRTEHGCFFITAMYASLPGLEGTVEVPCLLA